MEEIVMITVTQKDFIVATLKKIDNVIRIISKDTSALYIDIHGDVTRIINTLENK